jgi:hypothetical protein
MTDNNLTPTPNDPDKRTDHRTPMKCRVKVTHPIIGEVTVNTRDISDSGIFLLTENIEMPPIGTIVQGQVQDMGETAPILKLRIVRLEPAGIGLKFVNE